MQNSDMSHPAVTEPPAPRATGLQLERREWHHVISYMLILMTFLLYAGLLFFIVRQPGIWAGAWGSVPWMILGTTLTTLAPVLAARKGFIWIGLRYAFGVAALLHFPAYLAYAFDMVTS